MTRTEAINALRSVEDRILRNVYDDLSPEQHQAIKVLQPNFEYPDWDWCKVFTLWGSKAKKFQTSEEV